MRRLKTISVMYVNEVSLEGGIWLHISRLSITMSEITNVASVIMPALVKAVLTFTSKECMKRRGIMSVISVIIKE